MIPKSGNRFSEKIMLKQKAGAHRLLNQDSSRSSAREAPAPGKTGDQKQ
jgi:hypothetical protein